MVGTVLTTIDSKSFWTNIGLGIVGVALITGGLVIFLRKDVGSAAKDAATAAVV
jgi:hypothetical protein